MADRTDDMDTDRTIHVNWLRFNVPSIVAVVAAAVSVMAYINSLETRVAKIEEYRVTRSALVDRRFDDIQTALNPVNTLPYRVGILEAQQLATNLRIDRFTEVLSTTLELVRKDVNGLSTKIEVLGTKVDALAPDKRAEIAPPNK